MTALTASVQVMRKAAQAALADPKGACIEFTLTKYGSLEGAATACRSFQVTFNAMRARERRLKQKHQGDKSKDTDVKVEYDQLTCNKIVLPNGQGFGLMMVRANSAALELAIRSLTTGELVEEFSADNKRKDALMTLLAEERTRAANQNRSPVNPIPYDDAQWWLNYDPPGALGAYITQGIPLPWDTQQVAHAWAELPEFVRSFLPKPRCLEVQLDPADIPLAADAATMFGVKVP